ncbi:hypothetical protein LOY24_04500 [Pseudomonas putida]|uniref:hypothetical protein n=1 Tax=Pseudomonas putida TaxID=303 RepID=UPI00215E7CAF|nr:hypothetical protein [Pseudomonas putida]UVL79405.1 hypothetical protein LOY24_04500 [Pseudomonas putida]
MTPLLGLVIAARTPTLQLTWPVDFIPALKPVIPSAATTWAVTALESVESSLAPRRALTFTIFCSTYWSRAPNSVCFSAEDDLKSAICVPML